MDSSILQYHNFRHLKPDDENELIVLFHLSLMPKADHKNGRKPGQDECFWIEVRLQRFLASRPGWSALSRDDKVKVMFRYAVEQVQQARRKLRHAHLFWTANGTYCQGPPVSPAQIRFPTAETFKVETEDRETSTRFHTRAGAGLVS